jgi:hypothetical protein
MNRMRPTAFSRRRALGALALLALDAAAASVPQGKRPDPMPNGTWKITGTPPHDGKTSIEYLPPGTRIRLLIQGPSTRAVTDDIGNELVAQAAVVSAITPELCRSGLGQDSMFGANICGPDGRPLPAKDGHPVDFEGIAAFTRVKGGVADSFFTAQGARPGAGLMTISFKDKGLVWQFWLKSPSELISRAFVAGPGEDDVVDFPQVWRKEA